MGKNDFLTPKAIANRIKAKGLQKLRWYCQLCQKQCRDENGFKCHQMSDSHRRQMEIFGQNPRRVIEGYSQEFEGDFLAHLKQAHPFSRVSAKVVYNEFINDRNHIHMNSTKWLSLTEFVKYLGREGKCKVEETPKGWFITLIQKDAFQEIENEKRLKRLENEREEEDRQNMELLLQVHRAKKAARPDEGPSAATELQREDEGQPLVLQLAKSSRAPEEEAAAEEAAGSKPASRLPPRAPPKPAPVFADDDDDGGAAGTAKLGGAGGKKRSALDAIMQRDLEAKKKKAEAAAASGRLDHWLAPGIIVKVMAKELKEHGYYKQKGEVVRVHDKYVGEVELLEGGDVLRVDQAQLETVLPVQGGRVRVVNGQWRGSSGVMMGVDTGRFQAQVKLQDGPGAGREVWLDYEDVCKTVR